MSIFSNGKLNDDFNRHDGQLVGYFSSDLVTPQIVSKHYDLRGFRITDISIPYTQNDFNFWNGYKYFYSVGNSRPLGALAGTESWTLGGQTIAKNASYRYANTLTAVIADASLMDSTYGTATYGGAYQYGSVITAITSTGADDILTDLNDPARTYYIEVVLRAFPAQSTNPHFDLANSFIDFSNTTTFTPASTVSVPFSASINDVTAGGDTYLQLPRSLLSVLDLTNIQGIRFRMRSINGTSTLIAQAMRVVDDTYTGTVINVDTKRQQLRRRVPRTGIEAVGVFGDIYFGNTLTWANILTNGSFESSLTPWMTNLSGTSVATFNQVEDGKIGTGSAEFAVTTYGSWSLIQSEILPLFSTTQSYTISFWARNINGTQNWSMDITDSDSTHVVWGGTVFTTSSGWQYYSYTFTPASAGNQPRLIFAPAASGTGTLHIDGIMLESGSVAHSYVDKSSPSFGGPHPKNTTYISLFNSGHNPTGNDNVHRQFFRRQPNGDRIEVKLAARDTQSQLSIIQTLNGTTTTIYTSPATSNILTNETFYYLVATLSGTSVTATIYQRGSADSTTLGTQVYTTGAQTVGLTSGGLVGYSFEPYNYDFELQFLGPLTSEFAIFQTTAMASRKLVRGTTLYPVNSGVLDITTGLTPKAFGDATLSYDANNDLVVTRTAASNQGGIRYEPITFIGDSSRLIVSGAIWVELSGTASKQPLYPQNFRVALVDGFDSVLWIYNVPAIVRNQWNYFSVRAPSGLMSEEVYLHVQQTGALSGYFKLKDIQFGYETIYWSVSPDNINWQPFLGATNNEFSGAMFSTPTNSFQLKASASTDFGWISGYQLVPQYVY